MLEKWSRERVCSHTKQSSNLLAKLKGKTLEKLPGVENTQTYTRGDETGPMSSRNPRGDLEEKAKDLPPVGRP